MELPGAKQCEADEAAGGVPVVDLAGLEDPERRSRVVAEVAEAWRTWGTFLLINHGVSPGVIEAARAQSLRVFSLPMEHKLKGQRTAGGFGGYGNGAGSKQINTAEFGSESFRLGVPGSDTSAFGQKLWPGDCDDFCEGLEAYFAASQQLTKRVVELLSEGLVEAGRPHFRSYFPHPCVGSVRMNYYPAASKLGLPPHTDIAGMVFLHQADGSGGLQVEKDGQWVTVQARSDALVVLMGTICQILTNGEHKAVRHRAIKGGDKDRLSMVFSVWPDQSLPMTPSPNFLTPLKPLLYKPLTFPEFWEAREVDIMNPLNCILLEVQ